MEDGEIAQICVCVLSVIFSIAAIIFLIRRQPLKNWTLNFPPARHLAVKFTIQKLDKILSPKAPDSTNEKIASPKFIKNLLFFGKWNVKKNV